MHWHITIESIVLIISGIIVATVAYGLWGKRSAPGANYLLIAMLASAEWCLASALEYAVGSVEGKILASKFQHLGIHLIAPAYFLFGLSLSRPRSSLRRGVFAALWIIPLI